jgi:hypothetical protein
MYRFKLVKIIVLTALLVIPVVLFFLPATYFDQGETLCPSKRFLDIECLGCGLTRGVQHFIHFDFETAWEFNKLTFLIVPLGVIYWVYVLRKTYLDLKEQISKEKQD